MPAVSLKHRDDGPTPEEFRAIAQQFGLDRASYRRSALRQILPLSETQIDRELSAGNLPFYKIGERTVADRAMRPWSWPRRIGRRD